MATIVILIRHDHKMTIAESFHVGHVVLLLVLKTHELLDVLNLLILHDLINGSISNVEQFTAEREDTKEILINDSTSSKRKDTGRLSFSENECAEVAVFGTSFVGISQLGVVDAVPLVAISLLHHLIGLLLSKVHDVLDDLGFLNGFQELVA